MKSRFYLCLTALFFSMATCAWADNSDTITFKGAVVNDSCNLDVAQNPIIVSCYNSLKHGPVNTAADLMNLKSINSLPVVVNVSWLNPEKSKGIVYVDYI